MPEEAGASAELVAAEASLVWHTRWGGLFFLVNLLLYLEIYHDLGANAPQDEPALPFWDFIALLGRRLVGPALEADPLWALLAQWSGRTQVEAPGHEFKPPETWQLPVSWLNPFIESGEWLWDEAGGRLLVWHPAGFWLADAPGMALAEWRDRQTGLLARATLLRRPCPSPEAGSPLARWLEWHVAYMDARLRRALALEPAADLTEFLLAQEARFSDSGTEIDVTFSLASLPVAVRLAGLDRDPGWIPAAGRRLLFHFEVDGESGTENSGPATV